MASAADIAVKLQRLSNQATEKSFKYNTKEANTARTWQKMMSDSSHQREVKDLIEAGLNPVLSSGGSGAQSYTTSSASAQAENAASAVGNIYGAQMSADATRAAAATSAAAMKAAAAQQAAAARYAASLQYQASVYHSDKAYEATKIRAEADKWIATHKQPSSIVGMADKYIGNYTDKAVIKDVTKIGTNLSVVDFANKKGSINSNNFVLNRNGEKKANLGLFKLGLSQSRYNRELWTKAFAFGDNNAMSVIARQVASNKKAAARASQRWYKAHHSFW